jgi:flagellum-specific peptidoglycan hydrolase FlgJ
MDPDAQSIMQVLGNATPGSPTDPDVNSISQILSQEPPKATTGWGGFVDTAKKIADANNFPASVLLGQSAEETGHGTSDFAKGRNNYFGYQAYDSNPDAAKKYSTPEQSIKDYISLIKDNPRYSWAYQNYLKDHDASNLVKNIWMSGYASDPNYVSKVESQPEFQMLSKEGD